MFPPCDGGGSSDDSIVVAAMMVIIVVRGVRGGEDREGRNIPCQGCNCRAWEMATSNIIIAYDNVHIAVDINADLANSPPPLLPGAQSGAC